MWQRVADLSILSTYSGQDGECGVMHGETKMKGRHMNSSYCSERAAIKAPSPGTDSRRTRNIPMYS